MCKDEQFEKLKLALEHGRSMFVYHADQRLASIRFYFAILAAIIAGQATLFTNASGSAAQFIPIASVALGVTGIVISVFFYLLDLRNERLVHCDEELLRRAETALSELSNIDQYKITFASHDYSKSPWWITYGRILPFMFLFFIFLQAGTIGLVIIMAKHNPSLSGTLLFTGAVLVLLVVISAIPPWWEDEKKNAIKDTPRDSLKRFELPKLQTALAGFLVLLIFVLGLLLIGSENSDETSKSAAAIHSSAQTEP